MAQHAELTPRAELNYSEFAVEAKSGNIYPPGAISLPLENRATSLTLQSFRPLRMYQMT